jgi:transketolase
MRVEVDYHDRPVDTVVGSLCRIAATRRAIAAGAKNVPTLRADTTLNPRSKIAASHISGFARPLGHIEATNPPPEMAAGINSTNKTPQPSSCTSDECHSRHSPAEVDSNFLTPNGQNAANHAAPTASNTLNEASAIDILPRSISNLRIHYASPSLTPQPWLRRSQSGSYNGCIADPLERQAIALASVTPSDVRELESVARRIRRDIISMTAEASSGHPGGSLSCTDILTALYFRVLRHDPHNPTMADRDRFVMSKGHASPAMYSVLAEAGYFPTEELLTFRKLGSRLQGHNVRGVPPGVEMSAGALGMGLSFSLGLALAARMDGHEYRVYCLLSDGDCNEGQTWEAAAAAAHHKADNLIAIVDYNHIQNDGYSDFARFSGPDGKDGRPGGWVLEDGHTVNILSLAPLPDRWRSFGWSVQEVDGHDFAQIIGALEKATSHKGGPSAVVCQTTKGKGVSFMENNPAFHGKAPNAEETKQALKELAD